MLRELQVKILVWRAVIKEDAKAALRRVSRACGQVKVKKLYRVPRLRASLEEHQQEAETWLELFFDLIYVAMAFKLGEGIAEIVEKKNVFLEIIPYFMAQFLSMYSLWFARTIYMSRYQVDSFFHSVVDATYALLVAFMALFIGSRNKILEVFGDDDVAKVVNFSSDPDAVVVHEDDDTVSLDYNLLLDFSVSYLLCQTIELFRCVEIGIVAAYNFGKHLDETQAKAIISTSHIDVTRQAIGIMLTLLAITGVCFGDIALSLTALILSFVCLIVFHVLRGFRCKSQRHRNEPIPMNVSFMIGRMGEFTMLMLGEGVLEIIISVVNSHLLGTFAISFGVLSQLHFIAFYIIPTEAKNHAFRKSASASLLIHLLFPISAGALIFVGIGLELTLKREGKLEDDANKAIRWLIALGLFVSTFSVVMQDLLHLGRHKIIRKDNSVHGKKDNSWENFHYHRVAFYFVYSISPFMLLTLGLLRKPASDFLGIAMAILLIITFLGRTGRSHFENDEEEQQVVLEELMNESENEQMRNKVKDLVETTAETLKLRDLDDNPKACSLFRYLSNRSIELGNQFQNCNEMNEQLLQETDELEAIVFLIREHLKTANTTTHTELSHVDTTQQDIEKPGEPANRNTK